MRNAISVKLGRSGAVVSVVAVAGLFGCSDSSPTAGTMQTPATYTITIENLTTGQPFSPGVAVTHSPGTMFWTVGSRASAGLIAIAEDGSPDMAEAELTSAAGVTAVTVIDTPTMRVGSGGATTSTITIQANEGDLLSLAVMLICTNDGFTGLDSIALPTNTTPVTVTAQAYDAGSEANTELFLAIVDPCMVIGPVAAAPDGANDQPPEDIVIAAHAGIQGGGDLDPALHGFPAGPARITIQRQ